MSYDVSSAGGATWHFQHWRCHVTFSVSRDISSTGDVTWLFQCHMLFSALEMLCLKIVWFNNNSCTFWAMPIVTQGYLQQPHMPAQVLKPTSPETAVGESHFTVGLRFSPKDCPIQRERLHVLGDVQHDSGRTSADPYACKCPKANVTWNFMLCSQPKVFT